MRYVTSRTLLFVLFGLLLLAIITMNATSGHFDYPDDDGCACFVSYTSNESKPSCDQTRRDMCDNLGLGPLLALLGALDFNR